MIDNITHAYMDRTKQMDDNCFFLNKKHFDDVRVESNKCLVFFYDCELML